VHLILARLLKLVCCATLLVTASACPRMRRLRTENARMDALATLQGRVEAEHWAGQPLLVVVMHKPAHPGAPVTIARRIPLDRPGSYSMTLPPGDYLLGAFEDRNRNGRFEAEQGERVGVYRDLGEIDLHDAAVKDDVVVTITDAMPAALRELTTSRVDEANPLGEGRVVPLSDARFAPEHAKLGLWQPATFQERVGMGVFMLEPYDPKRIPVLFVHGMAGHPREFETLVKCLEGTPYQPWVAQYASGWRLPPITRGLSYVLTTLHRKHGFSQLYLVAHSMGGLLARGMLREHVGHTETPFITKFVTLCSPLGGMPSADKGVELAPAVVPAWRDIGPSSGYVRQLFDQALPPTIEYSLFFAYDDDATDGVVSLSSQLRREAQREAIHMQGFETTHVGVLREAEVCRALKKVFAGPTATLPGQAPVK
jgi:pimeloyl-ACP methyl ester carboxylesterase